MRSSASITNRRRSLVLAWPLLAAALAGPLAGTAAADRAASGTTGTKTAVCHPGDTATTTSTQVYKGVAHGSVTVKLTCGEDGQWR